MSEGIYRTADVSSSDCYVADNGARVLVVEDDVAIAEEVARALERRGLVVRIANSIHEVSEAISAHSPTVIVMDRMLHGADVLPELEGWRREANNARIIIVSSLSSVGERVRGLKAGGDDYLSKPFSMSELLARVEVLHERAVDDHVTTLRADSLSMSLLDRKVWRGERELDLLPREFRILEYFMRRPNRVISRAMLLKDVWNFKYELETNVVDVQVGRLRRKVDAPNETPMLETIRGNGYMLRANCGAIGLNAMSSHRA